MSILTDIQNELKVPKNRYNSFGEYKYRSCEDILEAVKPLLAKHGATLTLKDEIVDVSGRIYVKATACLHYDDNGFPHIVTAFAREAEEKKKLDVSQITGTASSYARKYALNGLFLIDDTKDADTDEYAKMENALASKKIGKVKGEALTKAVEACGKDMKKLLDYYKVASAADLTEAQHLEIMGKVNGNNGKG